MNISTAYHEDRVELTLVKLMHKEDEKTRVRQGAEKTREYKKRIERELLAQQQENARNGTAVDNTPFVLGPPLERFVEDFHENLILHLEALADIRREKNLKRFAQVAAEAKAKQVIEVAAKEKQTKEFLDATELEAKQEKERRRDIKQRRAKLIAYNKAKGITNAPKAEKGTEAYKQFETYDEAKERQALRKQRIKRNKEKAK